MKDWMGSIAAVLGVMSAITALACFLKGVVEKAKDRPLESLYWLGVAIFLQLIALIVWIGLGH